MILRSWIERAGGTLEQDESPASHTCSDNGGIRHPSLWLDDIRGNGIAEDEFIPAPEDMKATVCGSAVGPGMTIEKGEE